ncbi:MAG: hypothetical protein RIQ68_2339, partial [Pseudomonadota bacterium]
FEGLSAWSLSEARALRFTNGRWSDAADVGALRIGGKQVVGAQQPAIAVPTGGGVIDTQARAAISTILVTLQTHGLISN